MNGALSNYDVGVALNADQSALNTFIPFSATLRSRLFFHMICQAAATNESSLADILSSGLTANSALRSRYASVTPTALMDFRCLSFLSRGQDY